VRLINRKKIIKDHIFPFCILLNLNFIDKKLKSKTNSIQIKNTHHAWIFPVDANIAVHILVPEAAATLVETGVRLLDYQAVY
jgi:hypothetical protein